MPNTALLSPSASTAMPNQGFAFHSTFLPATVVVQPWQVTLASDGHRTGGLPGTSTPSSASCIHHCSLQHRAWTPGKTSGKELAPFCFACAAGWAPLCRDCAEEPPAVTEAVCATVINS